MIKTKVDASKVLAAGGKIPMAVRVSFGDALDHISAKFLKKFRDEKLSGSGDAIKARPHGLFMRFQRLFTLPSQTGKMAVEIFTTSKIAKLHEEGGVMRTARRIAVPIHDSSREIETTQGAVKKQYGGTPYYRDLKALQKRLHLRVITVGGKTYLFAPREKGEGKKPPLFVLKNDVRLKPRLGFYKTWEDMEPDAMKIADQAIGKACKEAWK
ncbi:MAG: hypothetical protein HZA37_01270 [Parcubacteria group bacterium]|nr:hypothetical protein [Parcubacteria group bacterium]